jgi:hypothetical protein
MKTPKCNAQPAGEAPVKMRNQMEGAFCLSQVIAILILTLIASPAVRAEISEPDNLLYGTIILDSALITSNRTDVVIEARRTMGGTPIASYRMGANSQIGNFYLLRLALESVSPITSTNASEVGNAVFIIVRDATGVRGQTTYTFPERGNVQRTDFGTPSGGDSDGDGLPDAWEIANFGSLNQNPNTINANGQTTLNNFTMGSNPNNTSTLFAVNISKSGSQTLVSFLARRADGSGYEGRARYYSLESSTNAVGTWTGVSGFTNLFGNNQTVTFQTPPASVPAFYRGKVWLQGP